MTCSRVRVDLTCTATRREETPTAGHKKHCAIHEDKLCQGPEASVGIEQIDLRWLWDGRNELFFRGSHVFLDSTRKSFFRKQSRVFANSVSKPDRRKTDESGLRERRRTDTVGCRREERTETRNDAPCCCRVHSNNNSMYPQPISSVKLIQFRTNTYSIDYTDSGSIKLECSMLRCTAGM